MQDVGEAAYTEFKNDVELAAYMADHELWDCYTGLMHSHDMMSTFFSGTDLNTLREEGNDNNHFVSLIVNNAGTYTAAVTRKIKSVSKGESIIEYNTFGNVPIEGEKVAFETEDVYIEYYPLEITKEEVPQKPKTELELRLEEVRKNANSYVNRTSYNPTTVNVPHINIPSLEEEKKEEVKESKPKYKQQYLFSEEEMGAMEAETESGYNLDPSIAYDEDHINPSITENTVTQIITGDIFSIYKSNIDINKWAANMENLYSKRFGSETPEYDSFTYWVDTFLEFLENELFDDDLFQKGRDYMDAIWAYDVIVKLQEFPKNKYLDKFVESLERWLI